MALTVQEIQRLDEKRSKIKKEIYTRIYEDCCRKIRSAASLGETQVFLKLPTFLFGYPVFDTVKSSKYTKRQLEHGGFSVVTISDPHELYVSWKQTKGKTSQQQTIPVPQEEDVTLPNLMNLKKLANKLRKAKT
jgi:hypothetical protein